MKSFNAATFSKADSDIITFTIAKFRIPILKTKVKQISPYLHA